MTLLVGGTRGQISLVITERSLAGFSTGRETLARAR